MPLRDKRQVLSAMHTSIMPLVLYTIFEILLIVVAIFLVIWGVWVSWNILKSQRQMTAYMKEIVATLPKSGGETGE